MCAQRARLKSPPVSRGALHEKVSLSDNLGTLIHISAQLSVLDINLNCIALCDLIRKNQLRRKRLHMFLDVSLERSCAVHVSGCIS